MTAKAPFVTTEYVRWEDIDLAGIARYGSYTRFLDVGETDFYRSLGRPLSGFHDQYKLWFPRKVMHIDYHSPARLDDQLAIAVYYSHIGRTSATMHFDLLRDDRKTMVAAAHLVIVCVTAALEKVAIPPELKVLMEPFVMSSDEARAAL
jgi:YbgC/YbaW family acyl-CoA thioester hydrolase